MKTQMALVCLTVAALMLAFTARAGHGTDAAIDEAANHSYNFRVVLGGKVHADCRDGIVTLTGTVRDQDQETLAEDTVNQLPGVRGVDVKLTVALPPAPRPAALLRVRSPRSGAPARPAPPAPSGKRPYPGTPG